MGGAERVEREEEKGRGEGGERSFCAFSFALPSYSTEVGTTGFSLEGGALSTS